MNPLKQGLKHYLATRLLELRSVFIHESIKTRVETLDIVAQYQFALEVFIHESIKTRVETK